MKSRFGGRGLEFFLPRQQQRTGHDDQENGLQATEKEGCS
jgi:hypothetical protein